MEKNLEGAIADLLKKSVKGCVWIADGVPYCSPQQESNACVEWKKSIVDIIANRIISYQDWLLVCEQMGLEWYGVAFVGNKERFESILQRTEDENIIYYSITIRRGNEEFEVRSEETILPELSCVYRKDGEVVQCSKFDTAFGNIGRFEALEDSCREKEETSKIENLQRVFFLSIEHLLRNPRYQDEELKSSYAGINPPFPIDDACLFEYTVFVNYETLKEVQQEKSIHSETDSIVVEEINELERTRMEMEYTPRGTMIHVTVPAEIIGTGILKDVNRLLE